MGSSIKKESLNQQIGALDDFLSSMVKEIITAQITNTIE